MTNEEQLIEKFEQALLSVNSMDAQNVLAESANIFDKSDILDKIMTPALESIGNKWETGEAALSQVYMSGIICEELTETFIPDNTSVRINESPIAIVTFEDYHILGKRIIASVLKANGFKLLDYGQGIQADDLARKVKYDGVKILLISTLMYPSALHIRKVRDKLPEVKIAVGGAPFRFDENLWREVGADAMGRTGADAAKITYKMLEELS